MVWLNSRNGTWCTPQKTIVFSPGAAHRQIVPFMLICLTVQQTPSILDFIGAKDDRGGGDNWSYKMCKSPVISFLSLRFNGHFPSEPGLAGVYWSKGWRRWWWQRDYWSYKSCKASVKSSPPTNQHPVFLQAGCPSCRPTNSVKAL